MKMLIRLFRSLFLGKRFFLFTGVVIFLFAVSYSLPFIFNIAQICLGILVVATVADYIFLFSKQSPVTVVRETPERFSNGDENLIAWEIVNQLSFAVHLYLIDEFPVNWQIRDFRPHTRLRAGESTKLFFRIRPTERGEFFFGDIHVFLKSPLALVVRRKTIVAEQSISVIPSYIRLRQFDFMAHITNPGNAGYKQVRKTGHSLEFEQIREFVAGDDIRGINWKATGRTGGQLMINNYTDEKSQQIYCIIDKGRAMKMAFEGLTLMDYSINATLAMTSVAVSRQDRAGLISFGDKTGDFLPASHKSAQMSSIVHALYKLETKFLESDFAFLHRLIKTRITQRSLLIFFTNFESMTALNRQLPYLRSISRKHLLLVVFFENTSLQSLASGDVTTMEGLYEKVIAEKFIIEKKLIVKELQRYGIAALLTAPEKLSVDVVNKYLQIKARREI